MVRIERGSKKLIVRKRVRRVQGQLGEVEGGPEMGNREALGGGASFAKEREKKKDDGVSRPAAAGGMV